MTESDPSYPGRYLPVQSQQWKHQSNVCNLFKVNNRSTKNDVTDVVLVLLLLTLNRFHIALVLHFFILWIYKVMVNWLGYVFISTGIILDNGNDIFFLKTFGRNSHMFSDIEESSDSRCTSDALLLALDSYFSNSSFFVTLQEWLISDIW